jgi:hypothetical protein
MKRILLSEQEVVKLPPLKNKLLDFTPAEEHLGLNGYKPHSGLRPKSKHWRKPKDKGCFHVTKHKSGQWRMHWDMWDPRRHPFRHFSEVIYRYLRFPRLYIRDN